MSVNPYWVGIVCALSQYPGVQWLARIAREREQEKLQRERFLHSREGVLESGLCLPGFAQMATAQQAKEIDRDLEEAEKRWNQRYWQSWQSRMSFPRSIGRKPNGMFTRKPSLDLPHYYKDNRGKQGEIVVLAITVEAS